MCLNLLIIKRKLGLWKELKNTPIKKYRESCWFWQRLDGTYNSVSFYDVIFSLLLLARQTNKIGSYFSSDVSCLLEEYLKKEGIELNSVVNNNSKVFSYYDTLRGMVQVESRKKLGEVTRYDIEFWDFVTKGSEKANASFKNFVVSDYCPLSRKVCGRVIPWEVRKIYNDKRLGSDIPSPHIRMHIDVHGALVIHWLTEEKGAEGFDIFGFKPRTIEIIEKNKAKIFSDETVSEKNLYFINTEFANPWNRKVGRLI